MLLLSYTFVQNQTVALYYRAGAVVHFIFIFYFCPCGWTARSEQIPVEYAMMWEDGIVWLYLSDPI